MRIEFNNTKLFKLYTKGTSNKYKLPFDVLERFFMRIQQLEAASSIHDLWKVPSLKFEKLEGSENQYSIRITKKYRLEIEIDWEDREKTTGIIKISEISLHYED